MKAVKIVGLMRQVFFVSGKQPESGSKQIKRNFGRLGFKKDLPELRMSGYVQVMIADPIILEDPLWFYLKRIFKAFSGIIDLRKGGSTELIRAGSKLIIQPQAFVQ